MKIALAILMAFVTVVGLYLFSANAYIYHRIRAGGLPFTDTQYVYTIGKSANPTKYAALGDSLTFGIGAQKYQESYPYLVAERLSKSHAVTLSDFSYPGYTSTGLLKDLVPKAIESDPDIVTILIGTNDLHNWVAGGEFEKNYREIVRELKEKTDAKIYAISVPYIGSNTIYLPPLNYYFDRETGHYNAIIKRITSDMGITYIDIATPTRNTLKKDGPWYSVDSFHPSAIGYATWAEIIYAGIDK